MDRPTASSAIQQATDNLLIETTSVPFDFGTLWTGVEETCQSILDWETSDATSSTQSVARAVSRAYVLVYHLVSHPCLNTPQVHFEHRILNEGQQSLAVYLKLRSILQDHLTKRVLPEMAKARQSQEMSVMEAYVRQWRSFLVSITNLKTVFSFLAPAWNSLGFEENPFERIEDIALNIWSASVLSQEIEESLKAELATCVALERESGRSCPEHRYVRELKDVLAMLPDQLRYKTILESTYLNDLQSHFTVQAKKLRSKSAYAYAVEALSIIESESERASKYLKSKKLAIDQLVRILVDDNIECFQRPSSTDWMGDCKSPESREQIYCVYNLLSRSRRVGMPLLEERFTAAVVELTAREVQASIANGGDDCYGAIIRAFLAAIKSWRDVVTDAFHEDVCLVEAMENGLRYGLLACGRGVIDYRALAERLAALSCGAFLLPQLRLPDQLSIEDIVCVYFFLPDSDPSAKEVFLVSYQKQLARRLLSEEYNPTLEQQALYLLVQVKQSPLLFACRTMLRATTQGNVNATTSTVAVGTAVYNAIVLPKGMWPAPAKAAVQPPPEMESAIQLLESAAALSADGRLLALAPSLSYGVVKMKLPTGSKRSHVHLKVNMLQMCLLQLLNQTSSWTFADLCGKLGCLPKDCAAALAPFAGVGIIACTLPPAAESEVGLHIQPGILPDQEQLTLIPEVTQVDLLPAPGLGDAPRTGAVLQLHPQAAETCVTRFLKTDGAKTLDEIHKHVCTVLHPSPMSRVELKKAIEKLLDRQFVARDDSSRTFKYLP